MNKLKKIGITALAGSLATLSAAEAGTVSVNGTAELSWTKLSHQAVTGNPVGQKKNITFSGSGEFSNGWTYGITHVMNDTFTGMSSSSMNINMGGVLTIAYDHGTGGYGANTVDNVVPTAWEEVDYGFATGLTDVGAVSKTKGVVNLTLKAPVSGSAISFSYASRMGGAGAADGGTDVGGDAGTRGIDAYIDFWNVNGKYFDIRTGVAAEMVKHAFNCRDTVGGTMMANNCQSQKGDAYAGTIYQTLGIGPISAGFQAFYKDPGTAGGIENNRGWVAGAAFTIGNYVSISAQKGWDQYYYSDQLDPTQHGGSAGEVPYDDKIHASFRGVSAAINWGPLALKGVVNRVDEQGGKHQPGDGRHEEHREINLSMAF